MSVSAPVEAASANRVNISVYEKDCTTNQWNSVETGSINDVLKKYVIVFRQSFYRETAYRKFQKTTKKSRHRIHQKNLIRQRNQTHRKKPGTSEKPEESQPGGTESGGNSTTDSEQPKDDVTENFYAKTGLKTGQHRAEKRPA